jgi:hypothetical protein
MKWTPENVPPELTCLPEPALSVALEVANELIESRDLDEAEVLQLAKEQALNWESERTEAALPQPDDC